MLVLRSTLYFFFMVLSVIVASLLMVMLWPAGSFLQRSRIANAWGRANLVALRLLCRLDYHIDGMENIPDGPCVIMSKHQSSWETIALRGLLPPDQAWVLKRELMWLPFFGWALAVVQPIAIDRGAGRQAVKQLLRQGSERLADGRKVIIFPEGTRVAAGQRGKYGIGGAMLAHNAKVPVIPVALNAGVFWPRRGLIKYPGTVRVVIGKPIDTSGLKAAQINRLVEDWIEGKVAELPATRDDVSAN